MQTIHYFAGGNTAQGFHSCFEALLPLSQRKRMFYLKGGPGVGKSTLMKRFAAAAEEKGIRTESFHCSSDPESLDGAAFPELGIGIMDGTAPHICDPAVPGARDTLIALGDYLDEEALRPHARDIAQVQEAISARFARCYRYLAAAAQVLKAAPAPQEDERKTEQLADTWAHSLPLRGGTGSIRRLFASAFTPKGLVTVTDFSLMERCATVDCPFGSHVSGLMHAIARRAAGRGLDVIELADPLLPNRTAHVLVPAHGVAFCTGRRTAESGGEWIDCQQVFDRQAQDNPEQSFDRNAYELLCQRAVEQLMQAKALHDDLESYYVKHMDFLKWQQVLEKLLKMVS